MKKLFATLFIIMVFATSVMAADKTITFVWNQTISSDFAGWKLYKSLAPNVQPIPANLGVTIPYGGVVATEYTSDQIFSCPDNTTTTHYFILTAYDTEANESVPSNEVSHAFDCQAPNVPVQFRIRVTGK